MVQLSPMKKPTLSRRIEQPPKIAGPIKQNLVKIADAYAAALGITRSQVSKQFYGRGSSLDEIVGPNGPSISVDKVDQMLEKFWKNWPAEAVWPMLPIVAMDGADRK